MRRVQSVRTETKVGSRVRISHRRGSFSGHYLLAALPAVVQLVGTVVEWWLKRH